ncbi:MAG: hypothetical protein COA32_09720 [Fluviicola sp.]|nr:MAG: hypothetical protein COA32_09720 [Fluviicola sp.]
MIYYRLTDLLVFLEECKDEAYQPINDIVAVLYDFNISEEDRMKHVIALLRFHGLLETKPIISQPKYKQLIEPRIFKNTINPTQLFDITFTNGKLDFYQNIN